MGFRTFSLDVPCCALNCSYHLTVHIVSANVYSTVQMVHLPVKFVHVTHILISLLHNFTVIVLLQKAVSSERQHYLFMNPISKNAQFLFVQTGIFGSEFQAWFIVRKTDVFGKYLRLNGACWKGTFSLSSLLNDRWPPSCLITRCCHLA